MDVLERERQVARCLRVTGETDLVYEVVADRPVPVDPAPVRT